ncbi:hypothetical protein D3C75_972040 [compost metagenome]
MTRNHLHQGMGHFLRIGTGLQFERKWDVVGVAAFFITVDKPQALLGKRQPLLLRPGDRRCLDDLAALRFAVNKCRQCPDGSQAEQVRDVHAFF